MALNIRKFTTGIKLDGQSSTIIDAAGELQYNSTLNKFVINNGTSSSPIVSESHAATLTNKTISGSSNTLSNIAYTSLATTTASRLIATNTSGVTIASGIEYGSDDTIRLPSGNLASPAIKFGSNQTGIYQTTSVGGDVINFVTNGLQYMGMAWNTYPTDGTFVFGNDTLPIHVAISGYQLSLNSSDTSVQRDNSITGGNNFADTLTISADTQADASQGGCIKLYARSATQPHVTEFYNSGILSGSINSTGQLRWSAGGVGGPGYGFAAYPTTGMYAEAGPILSWTVGGTKLMALSSAGALTVGASGGAGSSVVNGFLTIQGTGTGQFNIKDTTSHATSGSPRMNFSDSSTTLGQLGFTGTNNYKFVLNSVNALGNFEFQVNSSSIGSASNVGKWTLGASSGSQIHDINGGLNVTHPITVTNQSSTPSNPSSGSQKIYTKTDGNLYKLDSSGSEAQLLTSLGGTEPRQNFILNSNFDVWQRGSSFSLFAGVGGNAYVADRWMVFRGNGSASCSRVSGTTDGSKYALSLSNSTSSSGNPVTLFQTLENLDSIKLYNKTVSISAKIKAIGNTDNIRLTLNYQPTEVKINGITSNVLGSTTANISTGSFTTVTVSNISVGTSMTTSGVVGIGIGIEGVSTGNVGDNGNGFIVEQVMLNIGSTIVEYQPQHKSFADELIACQRFYEKSYGFDVSPGTNTIANAVISSGPPGTFGLLGGAIPAGEFIPKYKCTKRISPTVSLYSTDGTSGTIRNGSTSTNLAAGVAANGTESFIPTVGGGLNDGQEVGYHWTADAELN